jgi:hypothetical protein
MKRAVILILLLVFCSGTLAWGKTPYKPLDELQGEVQADFEKLLDLWRDGRYVDLYERTDAGREGKERFAKRLADAPRRPACCWEKLQEVKVTVKSGTTAQLKAKVGFEGGGNTEFVTRTFKLSKEEGVWRLPLTDLYSLANATKKKDRKKR